MNTIIELCELFAIEENPRGRFLIDNCSQPCKRLVAIGNNEVTYIEPSRYTGYYNFKVKGTLGTGLMQLKNTSLVPLA